MKKMIITTLIATGALLASCGAPGGGGGNGGGTTQPQTWFNLEEKYPELVAKSPKIPICIAQAQALYETVKGLHNFGDGPLHVVLEGPYGATPSIDIFYTAEHSSANHTDFYRQQCSIVDYSNNNVYNVAFYNITPGESSFTIPTPPASDTFSIGEEVLIGITAPEFTLDPGFDDKGRSKIMTVDGTIRNTDTCMTYVVDAKIGWFARDC